MQHHNGFLIALEGIDGSGKSTLTKKLNATLQIAGYQTIATKEPGGSPLGKQLRAILQHQEVPVCPQAEYLLFAADRAQHMEQIIKPALKKETIVLSDRMSDSSLVYQGYARGLDIDMIKQINSWAMQKIKPDLTIFVDVPLEVAQQRWLTRNQELSAFESEHEQFMRAVYNGFHALYKERNDVILIDGTADPETVCKQTFKALQPILKHYAKKTTSTRSTLAR